MNQVSITQKLAPKQLKKKTDGEDSVSTADLVEKFKDLDKKAAESVPPILRPSDEQAFTVKPLSNDPIVNPNRISGAKLVDSGVRPQKATKTTTSNQEWKGSLFDRLMSPESSSPRQSTPQQTTPRDREISDSPSVPKKRTIDFSSKQSRLNFSPDVIKHFEELTSEDAKNLDYNFFVFTYDFENNKKNDVVFVGTGKGLDQLREKLTPTTLFHAIYRIELVVRTDLPNFVKYFLLTWTGDQLGNLKRAHATTHVAVIEQFFECAFACVHIANTGPELQEDLERSLSNVAHVQSIW